jgi:hypothetical protein
VQTTLKSIVNWLIFLFIAAVGTFFADRMQNDISAGEIKNPQPRVAEMPLPTPFWQAMHETGNLEEYSWWKTEGVPSGTLNVVPDPTGSEHGFVLRSEITRSSPPPGDSHRLYPVIMLQKCYRGGYTSTFSVWADLPPYSSERGWISFATYSNQSGWKDLFGINLGREDGQDRLVLFHVPEFGKGDFTRFSSIPFPMKQWVVITVKVDNTGIMLFQNDRLVAEAKKKWGADGVSLCEAHWGLYGQGKTAGGILLNDDLSITFERPYSDNILMIRPDHRKSGTVTPP